MKPLRQTADGRRVVPLRPLSYPWFRGPASLVPVGTVIDGIVVTREAVALDVTLSESYEPATVPELRHKLANVRTSADVVAFVTRFGLLESSPYVSADLRASYPAEFGALTPREDVESFLKTAADMRDIIGTLRDVNDASGGDAAAFERLHDRWGHRADDRDRRDKRGFLLGVSDWAASGLTQGLNGGTVARLTEPYVFDRAHLGDVQPGSLRIGLLPFTLRQACYVHLAMMLAAGDGDICPGCKNAFSREGMRPDARFCSPACRERNRQRRYRERATKIT